MPAFLLQLLPIIASMVAGRIGRGALTKFASSTAGQGAKAAVRQAAGRAIPAALGQQVSRGVAKMSPRLRGVGNTAGGIAKDIGLMAAIDMPVWMGTQSVIDRMMQEPAQLQGGPSSLTPQDGGGDELSRLLSSVAQQVDDGDMEGMDIEQLMAQLSGAAPQRRLI